MSLQVPVQDFRSAAEKPPITLVRRFEDLCRDIAVQGTIKSCQPISGLVGEFSSALLLDVSFVGGFRGNMGFSHADKKALRAGIELDGMAFHAIVASGPGRPVDDLDFEARAFYLTSLSIIAPRSGPLPSDPSGGMRVDRFDMAS